MVFCRLMVVIWRIRAFVNRWVGARDASQKVSDKILNHFVETKCALNQDSCFSGQAPFLPWIVRVIRRAIYQPGKYLKTNGGVKTRSSGMLLKKTLFACCPWGCRRHSRKRQSSAGRSPSGKSRPAGRPSELPRFWIDNYNQGICCVLCMSWF